MVMKLYCHSMGELGILSKWLHEDAVVNRGICSGKWHSGRLPNSVENSFVASCSSVGRNV